jgi:hypothetical protein
MTAELRVTFVADEDWTGEIIATVKSGAFSGCGSAWFDRTNVKKTFLARLRSFPLDPINLPLIEGGFWSKENQGKLDQCHLRITIKPYSIRGQLLVQVDLASEVWKTADADLQNSATVRFVVEYAAVDRFASEFEQVLDGKMEVAVLKGTSGWRSRGSLQL